jgi:hypothetical protein
MRGSLSYCNVNSCDSGGGVTQLMDDEVKGCALSILRPVVVGGWIGMGVYLRTGWLLLAMGWDD